MQVGKRKTLPRLSFYKNDMSFYSPRYAVKISSAIGTAYLLA